MRRGHVSPTLSKNLNTSEDFAVEALGKVVGQLICGGNLKHFDVSIANMLPKEKLLNQEILGPASDTLLGSKQNAPLLSSKMLQQMVDSLKSGGRVNSLQISPRRS